MAKGAWVRVLSATASHPSQAFEARDWMSGSSESPKLPATAQIDSTCVGAQGGTEGTKHGGGGGKFESLPLQHAMG